MSEDMKTLIKKSTRLMRALSDLEKFKLWQFLKDNHADFAAKQLTIPQVASLASDFLNKDISPVSIDRAIEIKVVEPWLRENDNLRSGGFAPINRRMDRLEDAILFLAREMGLQEETVRKVLAGLTAPT